MFLDASAIVAIITREPGWEPLLEAVELAGQCYVSPLARFEASVAVARRSASRHRTASPELLAAAREKVDAFVAAIGAREIAIGPDIGRLALDAAQRYGKAVGHPAQLNFGDCFAYACAKAYRLKLLYKGNDFAQTDLA